jgi:hypothetical protein
MSQLQIQLSRELLRILNAGSVSEPVKTVAEPDFGQEQLH